MRTYSNRDTSIFALSIGLLYCWILLCLCSIPTISAHKLRHHQQGASSDEAATLQTFDLPFLGEFNLIKRSESYPSTQKLSSIEKGMVRLLSMSVHLHPETEQPFFDAQFDIVNTNMKGTVSMPVADITGHNMRDQITLELQLAKPFKFPLGLSKNVDVHYLHLRLGEAGQCELYAEIQEFGGSQQVMQLVLSQRQGDENEGEVLGGDMFAKQLFLRGLVDGISSQSHLSEVEIANANVRWTPHALNFEGKLDMSPLVDALPPSTDRLLLHTLQAEGQIVGKRFRMLAKVDVPIVILSSFLAIEKPSFNITQKYKGPLVVSLSGDAYLKLPEIGELRGKMSGEMDDQSFSKFKVTITSVGGRDLKAEITIDLDMNNPQAFLNAAMQSAKIIDKAPGLNAEQVLAKAIKGIERGGFRAFPSQSDPHRKIALCCDSWRSDHPPLKYKFGYYNNQDAFVKLTKFQPHSNLDIGVTPQLSDVGNEIKFVAFIKDSVGTVVRSAVSTYSLLKEPITVNRTESLIQANDLLEGTQTPTTYEQQKLLFDSIANSFSGRVSDVAATAALIKSALSKISNLDYRVLNQIFALLNQLEATDVGGDSVNLLFETVSRMADSYRSVAGQQQDYASNTIDVLRKLGMRQFNKIPRGDSISVQSGHIHMHCQKVALGQLQANTFTPSSINATVTFPRSIEKYLAGKIRQITADDTIGIQYMQLDSELFPTTKDNRTRLAGTVISVELFHNSDVLEVSNLDEKILIRIPYNGTINPEKASCIYWNVGLNMWSSYGCTLDGVIDGHVQCACNHLTSFSVGIEGLVDFRESKQLGAAVKLWIFIGLPTSIVVGVVLAMWLNLAMLQRKKIHTKVCINPEFEKRDSESVVPLLEEEK